MLGLKIYGYDNETINNIINNIPKRHKNYILTHEDRVLKIIEYLTNMGIQAIDLLELRPSIFYNSLERIKEKIENNMDLLSDIKEDYACFELIDL